MSCKDINIDGLCDELTVEKLKEAVEQLNNKNSIYDNFMLNITHDLRGHLNVIISGLQCIEQSNSNNIESKYVNIIKRNSYKMLKLINNLIDTNRLENNYYKLNRKKIDIVSLIESTVNCIAKYANEKSISIIFDTNEEECIMAVDIEAIDRIIMNLLSNAIKFSKENSTIWVSLDIEKDYINISVKDEGRGISQEEQKKIFDRFYQSSVRERNDIIGSGIGLDLCNYLVKSHDGVICLSSILNEGSEFRVKLPRVINEDSQAVDSKINDKVQTLEIEFSDIYLS